MPTNRRPTVRQRAARRRKRHARIALRVARALGGPQTTPDSIYSILDTRMRSAYSTIGSALAVETYLRASQS